MKANDMKKCIMCGKPAEKEQPGIGRLCDEHYKQMTETTEEAQRKLGIDPGTLVDLNEKSGIEFADRGPARTDLSQVEVAEDDETGMGMLKKAHVFIRENLDGFAFDNDSYVFTPGVGECEDEPRMELADEHMDNDYKEADADGIDEVAVRLSGRWARVDMRLSDGNTWTGAAGFSNPMYDRLSLELEYADDIMAGRKPGEKESTIIIMPKN